MAAQSREAAIFQSILHSKGMAAARAWAKKNNKGKPPEKHPKSKKGRGKGYVPRSKQGGSGKRPNPFASKGEPKF